MPNIFPPDPSVQITTSSAGDGFSEKFIEDLKNKTRNADINDLFFENNAKSILIRTKSYQDQIKLKDFLQKELNENYSEPKELQKTTELEFHEELKE